MDVGMCGYRNDVLRKLALLCFGGLIAGAAILVPKAEASPGQCIQGPFGGFCDGLPGPNGDFYHCEGAFGFSSCFYVRPVPVSVDPRGWVPV